MLAVVTCHFNFCQYKRPIQNLHRFLRYMKSLSVPVYGVEIALGKHPLQMKGNPNWLTYQVDDKSIMFQKECLMNIAARKLVPACYDKIACLDADVFFEFPNWHQLTDRALDDHMAVQPFTEACWTNSIGRVDRVRRSCAEVGINKTWKGHPGFAWAFRRDFFDRVGLYPLATMGNGDSITTCGLTKTEPFSNMVEGTGLPNHQNGIIRTWMDACAKYNDGKVGFIPGKLYHEYHGEYKDRGYAARSPIARDMDATIHLTQDRDGIIKWTDRAPKEMTDGVYGYFKSRNEDGIKL